ncbi:histidinol-phosphate transaminase [Pyrobaculum aerophilum]|uniref:pyridoxal phosphate-dependent aminotransferase n=1 Tax=Pyrobaculum aerophilum TaxID=13773 RepID=UPI002FD9792A
MLPPPAGVLKLDQNEVPIPPPSHVVEAAAQALAVSNWYQPAALYDEVRGLYAEYAGVDPKYVWLFPGADDFFEPLLRTARAVAVPSPTYFLFEDQAQFHGASLVKTPLRGEEFRLDLAEFLDAARRADAVYLDNPNNPTGQLLLKPGEVEEVLALGKPTIIDEAYFEFSGATVANLVDSWPNLAVVRTMSKAFLLAGLRVTPVIAGRGWRIHYNTVRFRVSLPSLAAARAALYKRDYVAEVVRQIREGARYLREELSRLGVKTWPTYANFILARGPPGFAQALRKYGVWVRDEEARLGPGYVRITIGTEEVNAQLIRTIRTILALPTPF